MPQLQINQGPQDALLYDNSRSYFTNVGYVRTSNFQMELRDVDSQNAAKEGATVQYVIPKAADLLGPVDLILETEPSTGIGSNTTGLTGLVDNFGYACIDKLTFSVGSHDIEEITGEQLNIINELMRDDESRQYKTIGKGGTNTLLFHDGTSLLPGKKFIIPLGLFFTKHPSQYFPLAAIAGCNDIRISIRFKTKEDLLTYDDTTPTFSGNLFKEAKLRCHYIHVTGPEATTLMNKEHVRLLKVFQHSSQTVGQNKTECNMDLSFLHPVSELLITVRNLSHITGSGHEIRNYFNYLDTATKFKLTLNGQERHPGLNDGIEKDYLMDRLLPMLHSNAQESFALANTTGTQTAALAELFDRKAIYVYPFCLNPEGSNPSGAVNMSKVSHAKLTIGLENTGSAEYQVDVYAINYNWLQIKDGRALTSFA